MRILEREQAGMSDSERQPVRINGGKVADGSADVAIQCIDCKADFTWTAGEQLFFFDKHLLNPPKRCKECKKAKNRRLEIIEENRLTGKRQRIEVRAQCAKCGVLTTVPFYPSQGRPVLCRACFLAANTNGARTVL